ncbi:MAG TPA: phage Gp37/Gp68 family protein [Candidatus Synoicihabitans sp.]|nr:phage Gp37/Gp68 family protein [Candidatus Synoicihabitans sp.]
MGQNSHIEWCDHTFNPWIGCTKVSPGCANCYAETLMDTRYGRVKWGKGAPRRRTSLSNWKQPLKWDRDAAAEFIANGERWAALADGSTPPAPPRPRVFCASLADCLDDEVPIEWLADLLDLIRRTPNLDWLLLTKRPQNWRGRISAVRDSAPALRDYCDLWLAGMGPANVWIGTTVEDQVRADERIPHLLAIPARVRFLSCEPLLGPVDLAEWIKPILCCKSCGETYDLLEAVADPEGHPHGADKCAKCGVEGFMTSCWGECAERHFNDSGVHTNFPEQYGGGIHWVICGGESGPKARPMHRDWARSLRDQCAAAGVAFLHKQWGEWFPCEHQDNRIWCEVGDANSPRNPELWEWSGGRGYSARVGKKAAGRLLDGVEHNEFPK